MKYKIFGILILWLFISTFLVNAFEDYLGNDTFGVENPVVEINADEEGALAQAQSMVVTFVALISFNVTGLPAIFSLIFFTVPAFIIGFMTLEILISIAAAIIPF